MKLASAQPHSVRETASGPNSPRKASEMGSPAAQHCTKQYLIINSASKHHFPSDLVNLHVFSIHTSTPRTLNERGR